MKTLVTNGVVVTAADTFAADILVEDGKIAALGHNLGSATDTIDAQGMYVFPGGIDEHVHFGLPFGGTMSAPWETESIAAAVGGTTTVLDFAMQPVGGMLSDGIRHWREEKASGKAAVDYGMHVAVCDLRPDVIAEIPRIVEEGVPTLKCFMAYKGTPLMVDDETLFRALQKARTVGALVLVHQENGHVVDVLQKELLAAGKTAPRYHAVSRPPACEAEAAGRAIALAEMAAAPHAEPPCRAQRDRARQVPRPLSQEGHDCRRRRRRPRPLQFRHALDYQRRHAEVRGRLHHLRGVRDARGRADRAPARPGHRPRPHIRRPSRPGAVRQAHPLRRGLRRASDGAGGSPRGRRPCGSRRPA